jgi:hypothetical protein
MMYPLVRELAVHGIRVTVTCRVLNLARQPYDRWLAMLASRRPIERDEAPRRPDDRCGQAGWASATSGKRGSG